MKKTIFLLTSIVLLTLSACGSKSRFKIDTSENRVEVKIKRFDSTLLAINPQSPRAGVLKLYQQYPLFTEAFTQEILDTTSRDTAELTRLLKLYLTDPKYAPANREAREKYAKIADIESELSDAYTYIHHYFPQIRLPEVYFFVSGFNRTLLINKDIIAIGTDMYLGSEFKLYKELTYQYLINNMRRENISTDIVTVILQQSFRMNKPDGTLLDNIIFKGKILYLTSIFLPEKTEDEIIEYSPEQWNWCKEFEKEIWMRAIDQKDLFSTDFQLINKYLNDAPFTAPISQDSPGRLGSFIGLQIVESYMKTHKELTLEQLMREQNAQHILELSGYKP